MDERVRGATGSEDSVGRRRRRALRAISAGYPMLRGPRSVSAVKAVSAAAVLWLFSLAPALADSDSRYSAPLWTWITAIVIASGLSAVGLLIGWWFLRKRSRVESSE